MSSQSHSQHLPVLIVGAGPSGLLMSHWLTKYGVHHRIIDKSSTTGQTSRATAVHARTLEIYRMLGLDEDILNAGTKIKTLAIHGSGYKCAEVPIGDAGTGRSRFPFVLSLTQDEHEAILEKRLEEAGTRVERSVELLQMDRQTEDSDIEVTLRNVNTEKEETIMTSYVVGCDGAHSSVRRSTGIAMEGGTYERSFFVADIICHGDIQTQGHLNICLSAEEFLVVLPLPYQENRARLIGIVPKSLDESSDKPVTFEDCLPTVRAAAASMEIDSVNWFAHYKVHHRTASSFNSGSKVFFCGDAAHLHSPVGGQGMNTGLGDVSNLAWKITTALNSNGMKDLLSTYTAERKRFADRLVNSNDQLFKFMIQQNLFGWLLRTVIFPFVVPFIVNLFNLKVIIFGMISQTAIEYGPSIISQSSKTSNPLQGCRLPWIEKPGGAAGQDDNHALLTGDGWQAHVFGTVSAAQKDILRDADVPLHDFPWSSEAEEKGFLKDALYLLRPDGYIGLVLDDHTDTKIVLQGYIQKWNVGRLS